MECRGRARPTSGVFERMPRVPAGRAKSSAAAAPFFPTICGAARGGPRYDAGMDPDVPPLEEPLAELERRLIDEYLRKQGHDPDALRRRHDEAARKLLSEASTYAATKLTEIESRSHYVRELHDRH